MTRHASVRTEPRWIPGGERMLFSLVSLPISVEVLGGVVLAPPVGCEGPKQGLSHCVLIMREPVTPTEALQPPHPILSGLTT